MNVSALWVTSTVVGTLAAWYKGLSITDPYLFEVIVLSLLSMVAGWLILVLGALGRWMLVLMVAGALPCCMAWAEDSMHRTVKPSNGFHRYESNVPVSMETWTSYGRVRGRITNRHPTQWLRLVEVHCTPGFANGSLSDRTQVFSTSAGGWLAPGEHYEAGLLVENGLGWQPGMMLSRSPCRVAAAEFYDAPEVVPTFEITRTADRAEFHVRNTRTDRTLTRVSISCWVHNPTSTFKRNLNLLPLYGSGAYYIAKPGETVVLYDPQLFVGGGLSDCAVNDVIWSR